MGPTESALLSCADVESRLWETEPTDFDRWHVLHVRSRQEKFLSTTLSAMGVAHYLPLYARHALHGRRKVVVQEPLIPGYLFLRGTVDDAYDADRTGRVVSILRAIDQHRLHLELSQIHTASSRGAKLNPYPYLRVGRRVVIRTGPFHGVEGVVTDLERPERLILQVESMGRSVSFEIDGAAVDPLD